MKKKLTAAAAFMMVMGMAISASAAYDENLNNYTLDTVVVEDSAITNKFGDTITEQSYYRTGGDVKVITREEIEKRHYTDLTEAIKRIPGVHFQNPGYRGGEYGFQFYNNGVSINGDTRVVILVDGRRVDNAASERVGSSSTTGTKSTGVNLDQVTNMENVEKIEVIKGPGASQYGSDATGGVINIITRKGAKEGKGSIDLSTGSWHKHKYSLSYSGAAGKDKSWRYFVSANRDMSGDTGYKDGNIGENASLYGSRYKEDGANIRIDKEFNDKQNLKIWYNHKQGKDGYPIAAADMRYWNEDEWNRIIFDAAVGRVNADNSPAGDWDQDAEGTWFMKQANGKPYVNSRTGAYTYSSQRLSGATNNPGYRNLYTLDGKAYKSFSKFKNNDWDVTYTFNKENGMDSFVRIYDQNHNYRHKDKYQWYYAGGSASDATLAYKQAFPSGATDAEKLQWIRDHLAPFPGGDQNALKEWVEKTGGVAPEPTSWREEKNRGIELQYAKSVGVNDIIADFNYDKAKNFSKSVNSAGEVTTTRTERKTTRAYIQDKIHISDKWDLTPAIRYAKYSAFSQTDSSGTTQGKGDTHLVTPSLNTQYMFDDTSSIYFGWTKVMRPLRRGDYTTNDGVFLTPLQDEKGDAWTIGVRKEFNEKTTLGINYDYTRMSNAIATLPIITSSGEFKSTAVNAKEDKKSFNITLDHQFNKHLTVSGSYSHLKDAWKAKNGWILDPSWGYRNLGDINTAINTLRPANHYALNMSYENRNLYTGFLANYYTGCSELAFTNKSFLILDWNVNYKINKDLTVYGLVTNLTNKAYETTYYAHNGQGGSAMPGRCWMVGMKYTF